MIHQIYLCAILVVTVVILVYYYLQEEDHRKELEKINRMEIANRREQQQMAYIRSQSTPCNAGDFADPRSCYVNSGYACAWNEAAKRCDQKQ